MARVTSVGTAFGGRPGPGGKAGADGADGTAGGGLQTFKAGDNLSGHRVVRPDGAANVTYASNRRLLDAHSAFGVTTGAAASGADVQVQTEGRLTEPTWNWIPDTPVFVGIDGQLTQYAPTLLGDPLATFSLVVGVAVSPTTLNIDFKIPIVL